MKNKNIVEEIIKEVEEENKKEKRITPISEILKMEEKEQPFLIDKLIPENAITAITSKTGQGKSLIALKLAKHIAKGEKLFDCFEIKKKKVLFLDLEMNLNDIISRSKSVVGEDVDIDFIYQQDFKIDNEKDFEWLLRIAKQNEYGLIVFDTLNSLHSKEENSASEMRQVNSKMLELIAKTGTTILYLHHHYKTRNGERTGARGSTDITAKLASHLSIQSNQGLFTDGRAFTQVVMTQEKARLLSRFNKISFDFSYNPETKLTEWNYKGEIDLEANAIDRAKEFIMEFLEEGESSVSQILEGVKDKGITLGHTTIREALKKLENSEKINSKKGEGRQWNTKFYSLPRKEENVV